MSERNGFLDFGGYKGENSTFRAEFVGIDWAKGRDWSGLRCPRCSCRHIWRKRTPKECRLCGLTFIYADAGDQSSTPSGEKA